MLLTMNLQLFAHKKVAVLHLTAVTQNQNVLGAKRADGQTVTGGSIPYRQRGTKISSR